jgi:hypothetical protein
MDGVPLRLEVAEDDPDGRDGVDVEGGRRGSVAPYAAVDVEVDAMMQMKSNSNNRDGCQQQRGLWTVRGGEGWRLW